MATSETDEYVETIMSPQLLTRIGTPMSASGRKRNRSELSVYSMVGLEDRSSRKPKVARKKMYGVNQMRIQLRM